MTSGITAMCATAILVFGRAIQQQNVIHGNYLAAAMTPSLIAAGEIAVVGAIVVSGWAAWPWISAGGAMGAVGAMWIHRRFRRRHEQRQPNPIHETEDPLSAHGQGKS